MLDYEIYGSFTKDRKLMEKRHKNIHKLRDVMNMLIQEIPLLPKHKEKANNTSIPVIDAVVLP